MSSFSSSETCIRPKLPSFLNILYALFFAVPTLRGGGVASHLTAAIFERLRKLTRRGGGENGSFSMLPLDNSVGNQVVLAGVPSEDT